MRSSRAGSDHVFPGMHHCRASKRRADSLLGAGARSLRRRESIPLAPPPRCLVAQGAADRARPSCGYGLCRRAAFMTRLRSHETTNALTLEFCILTATRSGEVFGARWDEFDINSEMWTIPGPRMKSGVAHEVALGLTSARDRGKDARAPQRRFVFPGTRPGKPLTAVTFRLLLRHEDRKCDAQGFGRPFAIGVATKQRLGHGVIEAALAHRFRTRVKRPTGAELHSKSGAS
jgi:integrase